MSRGPGRPKAPRSSVSTDDAAPATVTPNDDGRRPPIPLAWIQEPKGETCPLCRGRSRVTHSHQTTVFGGRSQARNRKCVACGHTWGSFAYTEAP